MSSLLDTQTGSPRRHDPGQYRFNRPPRLRARVPTQGNPQCFFWVRRFYRETRAKRQAKVTKLLQTCWFLPCDWHC